MFNVSLTAANIVNKWLYKIMLSPADRFANFFLLGSFVGVISAILRFI
jgi:hypothetical protein